MAIPAAIDALPGDLTAPGLDGAFGFREQMAGLLFEQRRAENLVFCRHVISVR